MWSVPNHDQPSSKDPNSTQRNAELVRKAIEEAATAVAMSLRRPWELLALREHAWQHIRRRGVFQAWMDHDDNRGYRFPHQLFIRRELVRYAKDSAPSAPSEEAIRDAYDAYSKDEWKDLIADLDRANLQPLLTYLQANKHELTRARGAWIKDTNNIEQRVRELAAAARLKYGAVFKAASRGA